MIKLTNLDVKKMTIGQMARMNHISEQTLRLYDREGLLSPLGRDEKNGYRYYDIRQSAQLDMIQHMKSLGMSLKDIRSQLQDFDLEQFKKLNGMECVECGCCSWICPARKQLTQAFKEMRVAVRNSARK